jgi:hypothetical protein
MIVETLSKCSDDFSDQYEIFTKDASIELQDEYDKFMID